MTTQEMVDLLALRLEDANKVDFSDAYKLEALNNAQIRVANMLNNKYLTELEVEETSFTIGGVTAGQSLAMNSTNLTNNYSLLRGAEGVLRVKDSSTGIYLTQIDLSDVKKNENSYLAGSVINPLFFVFEGKIYTLPTTGISAVDVWYVRQPLPLYYTMTASDGGASTLLSADTNLNTTTNYYQWSAIWNITDARYFSVYSSSETGGTTTFNCDGSATPGANNETFYLVRRDFDTMNLSQVTCELSADLHSIVLDIAEADCWTVDADFDRRQAALDNAFSEIKALNERVTDPEGIGTSGDEKYAAPRATA